MRQTIYAYMPRGSEMRSNSGIKSDKLDLCENVEGAELVERVALTAGPEVFEALSPAYICVEIRRGQLKPATSRAAMSNLSLPRNFESKISLLDYPSYRHCLRRMSRTSLSKL
jgi:hypothetical protein